MLCRALAGAFCHPQIMTSAVITPLVVLSQKGTPVTTSLLVAEKFGKHHRNVLRDIDGLIAQLASNDVLKIEHPLKAMFAQVDNWVGQQNNRHYVMTRDGFTLLVMGFTGPQAMAFKLEYLNEFNRMEAELQVRTQAQQLPQTFAQALRALAEAEEIKEQQQVLLTQQAGKIEEDAPKVDFYEAVTTSEQVWDLAEAAAILTKEFPRLGRSSLVKFLRREELFRQTAAHAFAQYYKSGHFREVFNHTPGYPTTVKTVVTGKGLALIRKRLSETAFW